MRSRMKPKDKKIALWMLKHANTTDHSVPDSGSHKHGRADNRQLFSGKALSECAPNDDGVRAFHTY